MKVIDLLNKIANDEEVPTRIKYRDDVYEALYTSVYNKNYYMNKNNYDLLLSKITSVGDLNDYIEVVDEENDNSKLELEEDNIIKKLAVNLYCDEDRTFKREVNEKINEIIDYLKTQR